MPTELQRRDLDRAVEDGVLSPEQADALWARAAGDARGGDAIPAPAADPVRAALVAGVGLVASGSAAWLLERRSFEDAAGVLAGVAVAMVAVAVHGLQHAFGLFPEADGAPQSLAALVGGHLFPAALAALAAAVVALRSFAAPILAAILVAVLWFAVMLAAPVVFGPTPTWGQRALLSALLGLVVLAAGVALDGRTRRDFSGWLYLSGRVAFWGGLTTYHAETEPALLLGAAVNAGLVAVSLLLHRRMFAVFGVVGIAGVLGRLAEEELDDA